MRSAALEALAHKLEDTDRKLLSSNFNGYHPLLDPQELISEEFVYKAAARLKLPVEEVKARYNALAARFKLRLAWQE